MSTRTERLAIRLLNSKRAPEVTEKELLKSAKRIWSLDRHQTYQKPSEIHHHYQIPVQKRKLYSIVPVQLEIAERERSRQQCFPALEKMCSSQTPTFEKDIKAKSWDELIVQVLRLTLDARVSDLVKSLAPSEVYAASLRNE
jgi:hypothetical protein